MKNLMLAASLFTIAFAIIAACRQKKRSNWVMTFCELYEDNDVSLEELING